jgi:NADP-dependent 3-hydroxy acid dehydrogenase YdfG
MRINPKTKRFREFIATPGLLTTRLLLAALFVLAGMAQSPAQNVVLTGALSGRITDQSGAVVAGASLAVQNLQTGLSQSAETNHSGLYRFPVLTPGFYSIAATRKGFRDAQARVRVQVGNTTSLDIKLQVGAS